MLRQESGINPMPKWLGTPAWGWCLSSEAKHDVKSNIASPSTGHRRAASTKYLSQNLGSGSAWAKNTFLTDCATLTSDFLSSPPGLAASGERGILPTAPGHNFELRRIALSTIVVALHLYREELKLNVASSEADDVGLSRLAAILAQLGGWLGWEAWNWNDSAYYACENVDMDRWRFNIGKTDGDCSNGLLFYGLLGYSYNEWS
jgi:anaphase-promoting complex subunit 1